ncbi:MAG: CRISPR-associated protein Cas4 [Lachnospiraceae bacterium]|nr:CRISPR-associated protein Cas4 [Lachnospiraceae bacterium]
MSNEIFEEDYRQLSELQHFLFCRRQWALIHVEQQWAENLKTVEGEIMHKRVHDDSQSESRGDCLIIRGMKVKSDVLCAVGICDVVEFHRDEEGITLHGRKGKWKPRPIEYKRGKPKHGLEDEVQLCGQAMCLEEMLFCKIDSGDLFYGEPHRRYEVQFTEELRTTVKNALEEMNQYYRRGYTPKVKKSPKCRNCSLNDICLPSLQETETVEEYLQRYMKAER